MYYVTLSLIFDHKHFITAGMDPFRFGWVAWGFLTNLQGFILVIMG